MEILEHSETSKGIKISERDIALLNEFKNSNILENFWERESNAWLKTSSYCGTFNLAEEEISILPKIIRDVEPNKSLSTGLGLLFSMIEFSYPEHPEYEEAIENFNASRRGNWAAFLLATLLQKRVSQLVKTGLVKGYVPIHENLQMIRGRIDLKGNIRQNQFDVSKCMCIYDDFVLDMPANQLIKSGVRQTLNLYGLSYAIRRKLESLYWQFEEITEKQFSLNQMKMIQASHNRLTSRYKSSHETIIHLAARKFFGSELFAVVKGNVFVDMDYLYQHFLTHLIRKRFQKDYRILTSRDLEKPIYLGQDQFGRQVGRLLPDIIISKKKDRVPILIIDAKYKRATIESGKIKDVANPDYTQMWSYLETLNCKQGMLIYPSIEKTFGDHEPSITIGSGLQPTVHVGFLDIPTYLETKLDFIKYFEPLGSRIESLIKKK